MTRLITKIVRKIKHFFVKPIEIFVFHKVSDMYDSNYGGIEDWTNTEVFKKNIKYLQQCYEFISLDTAVVRLKNDRFRWKNYAVLTTDDGYRMNLDILSWLNENHIPTTVFLSTQYLDGQSYDHWFDEVWKSKTTEEINQLLEGMYIHYDDLSLLDKDNISVALHGYGHDLVAQMQEDAFRAYVKTAEAQLDDKIKLSPYYAYTWGKHSRITDSVLNELGLIPLYCDGNTNYQFDGVLHRKSIDNKIFL